MSFVKFYKGAKIMNNDNDELITVDQLCEFLLIGKNVAYQLLSSGQIKCFRINRIWKIPRASVVKYIQEQSGF